VKSACSDDNDGDGFNFVPWYDVCLEGEFKRFVYVVDVIYDSGYVDVR
jgi:hypothetical protein